MSKEEEIYQQVEQYLHKKMDAVERARFERELRTDQELQEKLRAHQIAEDLIIEYKLKDVKELLLQEEIKAGKKGFYKNIILATGVLLIALVGGLWFISQENKNNQPTFRIQNSKTIPETVQSPKLIVPDVKNPDALKSLIIPEKPGQAIEKFIIADKTVDKVANQTQVIQKDSAQSKSISVQPAEKLNKAPQVATDPCNQIKISSKQTIEPACKGLENGSLIVSSLTGGKAPYTIQLLDDNQKEVDRRTLGKGVYQMVVIDQNLCKLIIEGIQIPEKVCAQEFSFNPFSGEQWEIPAGSSPGKLMIHDQSGNNYFEKQLSPDTKEFWSGQGKNGELKTGYFLFDIQYSDGSRQQGTITIVQ